MTPLVSNESAEIILVESKRATTIQIEVVGTVFLADMIQDQGDGYRPFNPLIVSVGGAIVPLPHALEKGMYLIVLMGDEFNGKGLMLTGLQLFNIREITLLGPGETSASAVSEGTNEELVGSQDGVNQLFQSAQVFIPGTTKIYLNTTRQVLGLDYVEVGNQNVSLSVPPVVGDILRIDYLKG